MKKVVVYSRPGCHLCEALLMELAPLCRGRADIEVRDVDDEPEWAEEHGLRIPVVEVDGREVCHFHLDRSALELSLSRT